MTPLLPSNPATITAQPSINSWTLDDFRKRYVGRSCSEQTLQMVREDLEQLRRWDTHEGWTSPKRMAFKLLLEEIEADIRRRAAEASGLDGK